VEVKIGNGNWEVVNGIENWAYQLDPKDMANGNYTIQARAYDGTDYSLIDSITIIIDKKKSDGGIAGFELVIVLGAIAIMLLVTRKRKN